MKPKDPRSPSGHGAGEDALGERLRDATPEIDHKLLQRLNARLADDAAARSLLDVAVCEMDSPVGPLAVAATPMGLVRVAYVQDSFDAVVEALSRAVSVRVLEAPARLDAVRAQLDDYFAKRRTSFELALDWRLTSGFRRRVLEATARIPYGSTASYRDVAQAAGNVKAVRAAGTALATNPLPIVVPCHRVLRTGGGLGGYAGGLSRKQQLLELEATASQ